VTRWLLASYELEGYALSHMIGPSIAGILAAETESYTGALSSTALVVFIAALLLLPLVKQERVESKDDVN